MLVWLRMALSMAERCEVFAWFDSVGVDSCPSNRTFFAPTVQEPLVTYLHGTLVYSIFGCKSWEMKAGLAAEEDPI